MVGAWGALWGQVTVCAGRGAHHRKFLRVRSEKRMEVQAFGVRVD